MADLIIKPTAGSGNKLIFKDQAGNPIITTADSGGTIDSGVTWTSPVISTGISGSAVLDSDSMTGASATKISTSESIKAYVDSTVTAQDLDFQGDSGGALNIDLDSETLDIAGGAGITTTGSGNEISVAHDAHTGDVTGATALTIADDAVTLAKMASGVDGKVITYDASGDPVLVGPGADGEVLTSTGAGSPPAFETLAVSITSVSDQANTSTGYLDLPAGTTAQRPGSPATGMARYDTLTRRVEFYYGGTGWVPVANPDAYTLISEFTSGTQILLDAFLICGGGGGGGGHWGAGGAGGSTYNGWAIIELSRALTISIGAGGTGAAGGSGVVAGSGGSSVLGDFTATGGGGGNSGTGQYATGAVGGSNALYSGGLGDTDNNAANAGGGAGGGEDGGDSPNAAASTGGKGGDGLASSITGSEVLYAPGGGGIGGGNATGDAGPGGDDNGGRSGHGNYAYAPTHTSISGGGGGSQYNGYVGAAGNAGHIILKLNDTYEATFSGMTSTLSTAQSGFNTYTVTAGTGTVTFSAA